MSYSLAHWAETYFGRYANQVVCPSSSVWRLRLPDVGAGEAQHSRHATETGASWT